MSAQPKPSKRGPKPRQAMRMKKTAYYCKHCGNTFDALKQSSLNGAPKYCSYDCARLASRRRVTRECLQCKKAFTIPRCHGTGGRGKYCSRQCAGVGRRTRVQCICKACGATFLAIPSQTTHYPGANQYCSKPCANKGRTEQAKDRPTTDRYGRTGRKADRDWQLAVREHDNYTCQRCGVYDRYIHTHHVAPRSRRPDLKHDVSNGKCLCGSCHLWCHHHPIEATAMGLLSDASYERAKRERIFCRICGAPNYAYGLCQMHHKRFLKYGDPLLTKRHGHCRDIPIRVAADERMRTT